ncbi:deleted in malignant brain tumors 1 protein-like [Mya arenaria]|uniref:deleted in malignant brain tumors 1 protein-like n=1 Tax=Mya arenaria TaxID=6604 RepID=UPI0022E8C5EA|nr:deleted in malignant brain tumors 1 protein-like [Mya arenaria]
MNRFESLILVVLLNFSLSYGETMVRLAGGHSRAIGTLQVEIRGEWLTVCSNTGYNTKGIAPVVCGMINATATAFNGSTAHIHETPSNENEGISMNNLHCKGSEEDLLFCKSDLWLANTCHSNGFAFRIECNTPVDFDNSRVADYAVGGTGSMEYLCDGGFGSEEAQVYCRTANRPTWNALIMHGQYAGSSQQIHANCNGYETDISQCNLLKSNCGQYNSVRVACLETDIQLIGGHNNLTGTAYVNATDKWRYICADHFGPNEARVVCKMHSGTNVPGQISRKYVGHYGLVSDLQCTGSEDDVSLCTSNVGGYCNSGYAAAVDCNTVRLFGGSRYENGRVEVYDSFNQTWETVCYDHFSDRDAQVICRQLGFLDGRHRHSAFSYNLRPTIQSITCNGFEDDLSQCAIDGENVQCSYVAEVDCNGRDGLAPPPTVSYSPQVRLVDGEHTHSGRVEVYYQNQWGTVCRQNFDFEDLMVVCRTLNYYRGNSYGIIYEGVPASGGNVVIEDLQCHGGETNVKHCKSKVWLSNTCDHSQDVSIDCNSYFHAGYTERPYGSMFDSNYTFGPVDGDIRLINGNDYYSIGRLEVYYSGQWGTVCSRGFDVRDAETVCRVLNKYGSATYYKSYTREGPGNGAIMIENLQCQGREWSLAQCESGKWLSNMYCSHSEDISVDCSGRALEATTNWFRDTTPISSNCGGYFNGLTGYITSPNYPYEYYNNLHCEYRLSVPSGYMMCLHIEHLDIETCCDHLQLYDGPSSSYNLISSLTTTSATNDTEICSMYTGLTMTVVFTTDGTVTLTGFNITFSASLPDSNDTIRLVNGHSPYSGRVEVYHNGQWGTVCDDDFDHRDVKVICRMLGYYQGEQYGRPYQHASIGSGSGMIWLDNLECSGYESGVQFCSHNSWGDNDCGHGEDAGVDCHAYFYETTTYYPSRTHHRTTYPWWLQTSEYTTSQPWWQQTSEYTAYQLWWMTTSGYTVYDAIRVSCNEQGWDIQVDMNRLRMASSGALASDIYLGDNSCTGTEEWGVLHFRQGLQQCLTSETMRNNTLVYSNELVYAEHDPVYSFIIRSYNWTVGVECDVEGNDTSSGHIHNDNDQHTAVPVAGAGKYDVNMTFYRDANFQMPLPGNPLHVPVDTYVYVKMYTTTSDWTVAMRVDSCYTRPANSSSNSLQYFLIKNGCEMDSNTHLISQSAHETRFVFKDFEYTNSHEGIDVTCDATFCSANDVSRQCTQTCNPVVRRAGHVYLPKVTTEATAESNVNTDDVVNSDL